MNILNRGTSAFFALFFILNMSLVSSAHADYSDVMCSFYIFKKGEDLPREMYSGDSAKTFVKTDFYNGYMMTNGWERVNWDNYTIVKHPKDNIAIKISKYGNYNSRKVWKQDSSGKWTRYWSLRVGNDIVWC